MLNISFDSSAIILSCFFLCQNWITSTIASNTKMELVATIDSCWPEVVPYIERVAQTDECYEDKTSDQISCFKFEDDTQNCGSDWTEAVIQSKKDMDYIITKAKYHLPPNSTFTTKLVINMKIEKFLNRFTTDTCFNKTVYSNVMMKKNGCATFNIYEDGYHVTMRKVGKNTPCASQPDEGVLCFSNINVQDQTTRAMNEMTTTLFDYRTSSISDPVTNIVTNSPHSDGIVTNSPHVTNSPKLEPSTTEPFPVTALASNTIMELVATINSCWPEVVPYIERVAQTDECYEDKTSDQISCFKFEDDTQHCGSDWTEAVIQSKKDMDYIITKAKHHLPPNSTFTTKIVIDMKIENFFNRFTTDKCFNKTVYSNVMLKKNGCATINIYEDGYHVTMTKVGKNTPCASQPDEGVLCFSNINVQDQTTRDMNEMTTTLVDYKTSSINESVTNFVTNSPQVTNSPKLEPSTREPFHVTAMASNTKMELVATIDSCWLEVVPYIERVAQTDECYKDKISDEISCFKFEEDTQNCGSDWTEVVIQSKKDMDYITTKAKYHLPPNSTFTTKVVINMKIAKFLSRFTTDKCFKKTVYSNVMMKRNGCATFNIYEDGYHVTLRKVGKNTPCASQPNEGVLCFSSINFRVQTTKAMNEMTTTSISDSVTNSVTNSSQLTNSPQLKPSTTESFPVTMVIIIGSVSIVVVILLSFGCFCFGKYKERKTTKQEPGTSKREIHDDVVLIPMQRGICNTTYDMEPEPLYTTILDSSAYTALMRSRSETALNVGGGLLLPQTGSLQRLVRSKGSTGTCRYQHKINLGDITRTSGTRTYLDSSVQDADYVNTLKIVSGSKTAIRADENSKKFASYNGDGNITFDEGRKINDLEAVKDKQTTITTGQGDSHKTGSNYEKCGVITDKDGYLALDVDTVRTSDDGLYLQPNFCGDTSSMKDIHESQSTHETKGDGTRMELGLPGYTALQTDSIEGNTGVENCDSDYTYPIDSTN